MPLTIGQRLKQAREDRYLTLEKASEETRIRSVFLKALEADDFSAMPSAAQGRGFLRNYASYLDINIDEVIAELQKSTPSTEVSGPLPQVNLAETDLPPLTPTLVEDEKPRAKPTRKRIKPDSELPTEPKAESAPEQGEAQVLPEGEKPKRRVGRKKKQVEELNIIPETPDAVVAPAPVVMQEPIAQEKIEETQPETEIPLVEAEQVEIKQEAKPSLLERVTSLFRTRIQKPQPESSSPVEIIPEEEPKPNLPADSADAIFAEIGQQLRERRELISLTMDEVERHTRLRVVFIRALEEGAFDKLPSPVQTRGMLSNYAAFLDIDTDAILLRFADALQARRREKYAETPREKIQTEVIASIPLWRGFIAGDLIFGIVMIAIILALAIWGVGRVMNLQVQPKIESTAPSIVDVLAGTPLPTPSPDQAFVPVNDTPIATGAADEAGTAPIIETPTFNPNVNVTVSIFALERAFVRVSVDGEVVFEGRMSPRETQVYEAQDQVMILTGNGAALRVTYNGTDLGLMGNVGEVVSRVYLISGVATPTATVAPTATNTPAVTDTPTPTATLELTPTP